MKVVEIREAFGLDHVTLTERPDPQPAAGQVLLRVRAASLNARDLMTVQGVYNPKQPLPLIPCSDGAGEIVAVGDGVTRVAVGDRVATLFAQQWISGEPTLRQMRSTLGGPLDGTLAELMALDENGVVPFPAHLSFEEAATLPCAALTAWSALFTHGPLEPGGTALVQGTGGVSIFALQFARALGARVIATSSREERLERLRELGAAGTINYKTTPDWGKLARELAGEHGIDVIVEVGGAGTLTQSLSAIRPFGQVSLIGVLAGTASELNVLPIFMKHARIQGIFVGHREGFEAMNHFVAEHELHPVIDRVFDLSETRAALEHLASGEHFGKICIRV